MNNLNAHIIIATFTSASPACRRTGPDAAAAGSATNKAAMAKIRKSKMPDGVQHQKQFTASRALTSTSTGRGRR
jgi:hypothetical protein